MTSIESTTSIRPFWKRSGAVALACARTGWQTQALRQETVFLCMPTDLRLNRALTAPDSAVGAPIVELMARRVRQGDPD